MPGNTGFLTLSDVVDPYAGVKGQQQTMQLGMNLANMAREDQERTQRDRALDIQGQRIAATADEAMRKQAYGTKMQAAMQKKGDDQIMAILDVTSEFNPDKAVDMGINENIVRAAAVRTGKAPDLIRQLMTTEEGKRFVSDMVGESEERKAETFTKMNEQYAAIPQLVAKYAAGVQQFQALKEEVGLGALEQVVRNLKPKDGATLEDEKAYQDATKQMNKVRTGLAQKAQEMMGSFLTPLQQELDKAKTDLALTQEAAQQGVPVNPDVLQAKGDIVHNLEQFATSTIQYMQTGDAAVHDEATSYGRAASNVFDRISTIGQDLTRQKREQAQVEAQKKVADLASTKLKTGMELQLANVQSEAARLGVTDDQGLAKLNSDLSKQFGTPLAKLDDIKTYLKDPNRPITQVNINPASPGERKDIAEGRAAIDLLSEVQALYNPKYVGWLDAKLGSVRSFTGKIEPEEAEFRAATDRFLVQARHDIFGSAFTQSEKKSMLEALPQIGMSDEQYTASLAVTKRNLERVQSQRIKAIEEFGAKAKPSEKAKPSFDQRYQELIGSGKSKEDAFATMKQEGY